MRIMNWVSVLLSVILLPVILTGCSINTSQDVPSTTPAPSNVQTLSPASRSFPTAVISATPTTVGATIAETQIPITWGNLNLNGRLVYIAGVVKDNDLLIDVQSLDLTTGIVSTLFQTPSQGWVDAGAVSPDGKQLVISYAAPEGDPYSGQGILYIMPVDHSQPLRILFPPASPKDQYYQPVWSPDGKYIYFTYIDYRASNTYKIMRMAFPDGTIEAVVDNSSWPRLSADSSQLVYSAVDPQTGINHLFVAAADGTQARQIPLSGPYNPPIIDVPMFSADGKSILFSAPDRMQSAAPKWRDAVFHIASNRNADGNIPSDWWSVPLSGGIPRQLTRVQSLALFGWYSPDNQYIASYTADGIFVMKPDGSGITDLVNDTGGIPGTVNWLP